MNKNIAMISLALLAVFSCTPQKSEWKPGEPDAEGSIGVYFDDNNPGSVILIPGEETPIEIMMHRMVTDEAADVPIIATCNVEGLSFPSSVHFDKYEADASFTIDYSALPQKVKAVYSVSVPDEYLHIYNDSRLNSCGGSLLVSAWEPANNDGSKVTFKFVDSSGKPAVYEAYESEMEILPGAGRYRIHDFLGGKSDFEFSLLESKFTSGYWRMIPLDDYMYDPEYGDEYYNMWYLVPEGDDYEPADEDDADYALYRVKDINGNATTFTYPSFYWYSESYSSEFCYVTLAGSKTSEGVVRTKCAASMYCTLTPEDGYMLPTYFYVTFQWDNPA